MYSCRCSAIAASLVQNRYVAIGASAGANGFFSLFFHSNGLAAAMSNRLNALKAGRHKPRHGPTRSVSGFIEALLQTMYGGLRGYRNDDH